MSFRYLILLACVVGLNAAYIRRTTGACPNVATKEAFDYKQVKQKLNNYRLLVRITCYVVLTLANDQLIGDYSMPEFGTRSRECPSSSKLE